MAEAIVLEIEIADFTKKLQEGIGKLDQLKQEYANAVAKGNEFTEESLRAKAAVDAQQKSNRMLQGSLNTLAQATNDLSKNVQANIAAGQAQNNTINQNRKAYNALYALYRDNPTPQLAKDLQHLNKVLKEQEGAVGDTRRNVGNYQEAFKGAFSQIASGIPALKSFGVAQQGVNAIMSANPIGGVVMLLQGLFEIFSQNAEIADAVSFAFAAVNKAVGSIIDTVVDTVSSLDKLTNALAHPIDFIMNLGKNMATAAKEGYAAAAALDEFELSAGRTSRAIEKNNKEIEANQKLLKDRTKSEQERIAIANKIADLEIKNADLQIQKSKDLLDAKNLEFKGRTLNAKQQNEVEQLAADVSNAIDEKRTINAQRQTRINILLEKEKTQNLKQESKTREQILKEDQDRLEGIADENARLERVRIELLMEGLEKEQALYELDFEKKKLDLIKLGQTEQQIEELKQKGLLEIKKKYSKQTVDVDAQEKEKLEQQAKDAQQKQEEFTQNAANNQMNTVVSLANTIGSFITDSLAQAAQLVNAFTDQNIEALTRQKDEGILNEKEYNQQVYELKVKAFKETKALNITQAVIATLQATLNAFNSGLQAGGPFGIVLGAIFAAAAAAFGGAQIALIAKQQPPAPQFAAGGYTGSGYGRPDSSGYKPAGIVHEGEYVIPKWQVESPRYSGMINALESGRLRKYADGGFVARQSSEQVTNNMAMQQIMTNAMKQLPTPVVKVTELEKVQTNRQKSINISEL